MNFKVGVLSLRGVQKTVFRELPKVSYLHNVLSASAGGRH